MTCFFFFFSLYHSYFASFLLAAEEALTSVSSALQQGRTGFVFFISTKTANRSDFMSYIYIDGCDRNDGT